MHVCTAGVGRFGVLDAMVSWAARSVKRITPGQRTGRARLDVGGIRRDVHLEWLSGVPLDVGDRVTIEIVEVARPDRANEFPNKAPRSESSMPCPFCGHALPGSKR
ncbi:MAG: hypothetical protein ACREQJ_13395 [Candidatus Binatia bacterium]